MGMNYRDFPLFSQLDDAQLQSLMKGCREHTYQAGQLVIEEGTQGSEVLFVAEGQLRVFLRTKLGQQELAKIHAPALVGELEWLTGDVRMANVEAVTPTRVLALPFSALHDCLQEDSKAMLKVVFNVGKVVATRLTAVNRRLAELQEGHAGSAEMQQLKKKLFAEWSL